MHINWNTTYIDPKNLIAISRGDKNRMLKYLKQFQDLIPKRIENLKAQLKANERKMIRQTLHQMSPQLQFFGIPEVITPIRRLEHEYQSMPIEELQSLVNDIVKKLENACKEVDLILKNHFSQEN